MEIRFDYTKAQPEAFQTLLKLEGYVRKSGIDHKLLELIKIRASQINGCAYCLDMHTKDARAMGETEQRLYLLNAWREAPFYTEAERAALALTEAVTKISDAGVPQELYVHVRNHFDEGQFVNLIMAINAINSWNRIAISTGMVPGDYQPAAQR
ncbi:carboxymuconolactone decarboxylase family protein [Paenibacillus qinlingensis]|uniref:carboxymuconolactone decarboxylase family protein n=1 Tax=Paenibacillus qinlingensis TaxID=1837343 RepID=UPI001564DFF8|nr:carboxymuconolactone decarboxylase family protein [Paenibacillus qinlingensis]NQX60322.1 carboxymuconolactone decarboxylase family protein [Paenibacillus qinlingensis]